MKSEPFPILALIAVGCLQSLKKTATGATADAMRSPLLLFFLYKGLSDTFNHVLLLIFTFEVELEYVNPVLLTQSLCFQN